ncbi:receptor like protein kinase S.2-like [Bidens hawaiensis]|uniref:receptor like protein kinase S.2-like n=1 Tax=Bidens hawaiensis TaxID=980011 RepID=UPI004049DEEE
MISTMTKFTPLQITLKEVVEGTNNFHVDNIIGHGKFGTTYKGRLLRSRKEIKIATRRFDCKHGEVDLKFLREISVLYDLKHTNLVSIVGFCDEQEKKIIVTMYEANKSLTQYLNSLNLTWTQRLRICVGIACALSYLHYDKVRDYAIIHCNINSDTILLDENWEAKLSSFEVSIKQSKNNKDRARHCEHIGTMGCMDPTIEKTGDVSHKSDIYSFGIILFEMLCGRKAFIQDEDNSFLAPLAKYHYEKETLQEIIHPCLQWNQMSAQSLLKYSNMAYFCLKEDRADRPDMDFIVRESEKALEIQLRRENIVNIGKVKEPNKMDTLQTFGMGNETDIRIWNWENKFEHLKIPLSDIKLATNNFSYTYKIGSWNEYIFYRAELDNFDKENHTYVKEKNTVVIKRYPSGYEECENMFYTEIEMLSGVKHPNIVTLFGFCVDVSEMIIVTENFSNGHLDGYFKNVNDERILTWGKRLKICIDVAHALKYLHFETEDQKVIIHRDIYSRSIVVGENWGAKIVDFGGSVFLPPNQQDEALYLDWRGRPSYSDPEYKKTNKLKRESDVYSFGVILLEILSGKVAYEAIFRKEGAGAEGLASMARGKFLAGTLEDMMDPILKEETSENNFVVNGGPNKDSLHTFMKIAFQCVAETQDQRPNIKVVVKELEKALFFQVDGNASNKQGIYSLEEKSTE